MKKYFLLLKNEINIVIKYFFRYKLSEIFSSNVCKIKIREGEEKFPNKKNRRVFIIKNFPYEDLRLLQTKGVVITRCIPSPTRNELSSVIVSPAFKPAFFFPKLTSRFQFLARRCRRAGFSFEIRAWLQVHRLNRFAVPQAQAIPPGPEGRNESHRPESCIEPMTGSWIHHRSRSTAHVLPQSAVCLLEYVYPCFRSCFYYFTRGILFQYFEKKKLEYIWIWVSTIQGIIIV